MTVVEWIIKKKVNSHFEVYIFFFQVDAKVRNYVN